MRRHCTHAHRFVQIERTSSPLRNALAGSFPFRQDNATNRLMVDPRLSWLREIGFADVDCSFKVFTLTFV